MDILSVAGLGVFTIRLSTKQGDKDEILGAQNNPHSGIQVFVADDELREICVLEIIKTYLCQPFNWPRVSPRASTPSHTRTPWRPAHDSEARRDMGLRARRKTNGISNF
ncbi:uncharacterized protein FPRN_08355 [Fusarium proliferatum]|nr:uncharacterized protein FPRN_08355 [Fusarium proliferatum]